MLVLKMVNSPRGGGTKLRILLSLPLPRSVGIEVDDDLLCLRVARDPKESRVANHELRIKAELCEQLPKSLSIVDCRLSIVNGKSPIPKPCQATYVITVRQEYINDELKTRIRRLLASESLNLQRRIGTKSSKFKNVDVRPFLKSIEFDNNRGIVVECKISSAGTIRVEEILKLLELDVEKLAMPIRRTNVQWQKA